MLAASHRWLGMASLLIVCIGCGPKGIGIPLPGRAKVVMPAPPAKAPFAPLVEDEAPPVAAAAETKADSPSAPPPEKSPTSESAAAAVEGKKEDPQPSALPGGEGKEPPLFADSFADVMGSVKRNVEGKTRQEVPGNTRLVHMFRGMPEEGSLVLQVLEDMKTSGPDEKPGVLALSWQEVPAKLPYSGFVYLGRAAAMERLTLPPVLRAKSAADLQNLRITFRYRAVNVKAVEKGDAGENAKVAEPVKFDMGWRFEPMLPDSFKKRLDFGKFTATDEWGTVDMSLADGMNMATFLLALTDERPAGFKIVWAQAGPITSYHPGDTLLIDDIRIKREASK